MRPESLEEYAQFFRRQGFLILMTAFIVGGTAAAVGLRSPRLYSASVALDIEPTDDRSSSFLPNIAQIALGGGSDPALMQTVLNRVRTRSLVEQALIAFEASEPDGSRLLPPPAHLTGRIFSSLDAGSRLVRIRVELRESEGGARNAALFANQLAEALRSTLAAERTADRRLKTGSQRDLVRESRQELERQLSDLRAELLAFAQKEGNPAVWAADFAHWLAREEALLKELRQLSARAASARAAMDAAEAALDKQDETILTAKSESPGPTRTALISRLTELEAETARMRAEGMTESSPALQGAEGAKRSLETLLEKEPTRTLNAAYGRNPLLNDLQTRIMDNSAELTAVEAEKRQIEADRTRASETVARLRRETPDKQARLSELELRSQLLMKTYEDLLIQENQLDLALRIAVQQGGSAGYRVGGVAVVDAARPEFRPVQPRPLIVVAAGFMLGLLLGLGAGLLNERLKLR